FQPRATDSATPGAATAGGEEGPANTMLVSLAPVPIGVTDSIDAWVTASYADGRTQTDSLRIGIVGGEYEHERLTVAPRFGSPLGEEDQARLRSDQAKANQVAREAHATPRLWSPEVVLPRDSRVTSGFGTGRVFNGQVSSRHMGLDLAGFPGDTVRAAADGVVALVDGFLLAGNIVYLNHGAGLLTGYFHLSGQLVEAGDTVIAGTPIGLVGATGRVTGPHLHWVVRYGTTTVDPLSLLALSGI
ncbi:MAG: M23 family metallopeptidase, partial [Gammaproteobacteria bacterium]|nr:M23 family metallopeptidase [Gammaproteobacteria bacterium]